MILSLANILVVDDDHDLRRTLCDLLVNSGYTVEQAGDGVNALKLIEESQPDLVVMDILMPDKDGLSTIVDIKRSYPDIRIVAISGCVEVESLNLLQYAEKLGVDAVLEKPFEFDALLEKIDGAL